MRLISGILSKEKRKKSLEKEIKILAKLVHANKGRVDYISALIKDISEFIAYLDSVVIRLEGNVGVNQHILRTILKTLGDQKRIAIIMMDVLSNVPKDVSARIKKEIKYLNEFIKENFEKTVIDEGRVYKGKYTRRHYFEKLFSNLQRDADIYRELQLVAEEEEIKLEEEERFREKIQSLKPGAFSEPEFEQYEEDAIRILRYYKREFEHLFKSLWDVQEEEYRNIRLIDHYLELLEELKKDRNLKIGYEVDDLYKKLSAIKIKLQQYIKRDFRQNLNLDKIFEEFSSRFEQIETNLEGIEKEKLSFLSGEIYFKKINGNYPRAGIVLVPGTTKAYVQYEPLIYRLVLEGYLVCAFNLPSQGSEGNYRVGLMSDYIYECIRFVRLKGTIEVGVVGHSIGAIAALFALGGYNGQLENYIIKVATKYIEKLKSSLSKIANNDIIAKEKNKFEQVEINEILELFGDLEEEKRAYDDFKQQILEALKTTRFSNLKIAGKIDAVVLLAPPESVQAARTFPPFAYKVTPEIAQVSFNLLQNLDRLLDNLFKKQIVIDYKLPPAIRSNLEKIRLGALEIKKSDYQDFLKYLKESVNPFDFTSLLDYFSKYPFVKYYNYKYIKSTPKLFQYGTKDYILGPAIKEGTLESAYNIMMGETSFIIPYPGISHIMMPRDIGIRHRSYRASSPRIQNDMIVFLRKYLNPGLKPWREVV